MGIQRARPEDIDAIVRTLHEAFRHDPVSNWVFPDEPAMEELHPAFMRMMTEAAVASGEVYLAPGAHAVALWYTIKPDDSDDSGLVDQVAARCGAYAERFRTVARELAKRHPARQEHLYLQFIGVRPVYQGHGLGTALLRHRLARADGLPAYLESSSPRSAHLYAREGFAHQNAFDLPDNGPTFYPMWRVG